MQESDLPRRLVNVLHLVAEGKRNRAIADELGLAEHTVENYVSELMELYGVESRTELALAARRADQSRKGEGRS
jgi:DNA-binding NarL/FixJ family response regulator